MTERILHLIFDLETTGFKGLPIFANMSRIIQISARTVFFDDEYPQFTSYVNPHMEHIPPFSTEINHIHINDVENAPDFGNVFRNLMIHFNFPSWDRIIMIAHNGSSFDEPVLRKHLNNVLPSNVTFFDSLPFLRRKFKDTYQTFTLSDIYEKLYGETLEGAHQADHDVAALRRIYLDHIHNVQLDYENEEKNDRLSSIRFIGPKRESMIKNHLGQDMTASKLKTYFQTQQPGSLDAFLREICKIDNIGDRQSIALQLFGFDRMFNYDIPPELPNLEGCLDEVDYYIKYKYGTTKIAPPNKYMYERGMRKLFLIRNKN